MIRYYVYDYARRRVTEYERQGECNQCGDCCRADIGIAVQGLSPDAERDTVAAGGPATTGQGVWQAYDAGDGLRCYQVQRIAPEVRACTALGSEGRCLVYPERNAYCRVWPLSPSDVVPFPRCGFTFVSLGEWALETVLAVEAP